MIIGLCGKLYSGKTSLANHLVEKYGAKKYSFASELREFLIDYLGFTREIAYSQDKTQLTHIQWKNMPHFVIEPWNPGNEYMTLREVLEQVGTEIVRRMHSECWVKKCINRIKSDNVHLAVIDDSRFLNELSAIKSNGGKLVKLTRVTEESAKNTHISNIECDKWQDWDFIIDNQNMTLEQSLKELDKFIL